MQKKQKLEPTWIGKPWQYLLIPHDEIAENQTVEGLAARFAVHSG